MSALSNAWRPVSTAVDENKWLRRGLVGLFFAFLIIFPFLFPETDTKVDVATTALAYVVMALGLNIVVGFAGLLDLGYVAFYALGALTMGWLGSAFVFDINNGKGVHFGVSDNLQQVPGIHMNFLIILVAAGIVCAIAGMLIGLPTLRLRGDYIAIVTLAFGEIVGRVAINGDAIKIGNQPLTAGRQGITPVDKIDLPFLEPFTSLELRPWYWVALALVCIALGVSFALRNSRLG